MDSTAKKSKKEAILRLSNKQALKLGFLFKNQIRPEAAPQGMAHAACHQRFPDPQPSSGASAAAPPWLPKLRRERER